VAGSKILSLLTKAVSFWFMYQVAVTSETPTTKRSRKKKVVQVSYIAFKVMHVLVLINFYMGVLESL
jgi:hypothetical protein